MMFRIPLATDQEELIARAPGAHLRAARWIRAFHRADFFHIGLNDHTPETPLRELLYKYGFVRIPRFELNIVRALIESRGLMLLRGAFSHSQENESAIVVQNGPALTRVTRFDNGDHAIMLNGYWLGPQSSLLYLNPACPARQFVCELELLKSRMHDPLDLFYLNCPAGPCPHVASE